MSEYLVETQVLVHLQTRLAPFNTSVSKALLILPTNVFNTNNNTSVSTAYKVQYFFMYFLPMNFIHVLHAIYVLTFAKCQYI